MRAAVYQYLVANCTNIPLWLQPYVADADTPKPYGVIAFGDELRNPVNSLGAFRTLYIWMYMPLGSFVPVDNAAGEIKSLLSDRILTTGAGNRFQIEWIQTGRDFKDDELNALGKWIEFRVPQIGK